MKQFAKSAVVRTVGSTWGLLPLAVSRALLGAVDLGVDEPVEVSPGGSVCCVSIDFDATKEGRLELNGKGTKLMVDLAERHKVPMTWAVCGKTAEEDPGSYGMILDSDVPHEIGVHTYSHADVSKLTEDELVSEVEKCEGALGLKERPKTFVFPWNREAHFDVLARLGFTAYRGEKRGIGRPSKSAGLWNIRPVYYLGEDSLGAAPLVKRYIDLCVSTRSVFHLWLHPWSVVVPSPDGYSASVLEPVFDYIGLQRERGSLRVMTLGGLAQTLDGVQERPLERSPQSAAPQLAATSKA